ncbi:MAG TPA: NADH-quinone oxidoreductase subunit L [Planctomycetota bacterium]|nr:NADH-quinone oxidoreductase subunit L [Planctomycetota bacterium]
MDTPIPLIPLFLLAGALFQAAMSFRTAHRRGPSEKLLGAAAVAAPVLSFAVALLVFFRIGATGVAEFKPEDPWISAGGVDVFLTLRVDQLTATMLLVITGVGSLIHLYSTGYLKGEPGFARYFACLNLFTFFMTLLVMGGDLLVLFIGWEGVGLCSYLLIGFWWSDEEKAAAGMKAFVVNRVGDAAFLIGALLLWRTAGTLDLRRIHELSQTPEFAAALVGPSGFLGFTMATTIALLLFIGATGKSAQIPLYVWLPDAMAGPTPVSALIHAATMVTAGVYLVARLNGLFALSPTAQSTVMVVGASTCLLAAGMALVQTDIKKVLAYSTVSQLGYMFIGVGSGAIAAGMFHVVTHAFFKACLFLGAGSVIYAMHHEQDLRRMGGLRRRLPVTFKTMLVSAAAMAGLPPLAGFVSKDEVLWQAFLHKGAGLFAWGVGSIAAALTAFYAFRLIAMAFLGGYRGAAAHVDRGAHGAAAITPGGGVHAHDPAYGVHAPAVAAAHGHAPAPAAHGAAASHAAAPADHDAHHGPPAYGDIHESPRSMTVPLILLALGAVFVGFLNWPHVLGGHDDFKNYLAPTIAKTPEGFAPPKAPHGAGVVAAEYGLMAMAILIAVVGVVAAHRFYVAQPHLPAQTAAKYPGLYRRLKELFGVDAWYVRRVVDPLRRLAGGLYRGVDVKILDAVVDGCGAAARRVGSAAAALQTGSIQTYLTWMTAGTLLLLLLLLS